MTQECPQHKVSSFQIREQIEQGLKTKMEICRTLNGNLNCNTCLELIRQELVDHEFRIVEDQGAVAQKCLEEINEFLKMSNLKVEPRDFIDGVLVLYMTSLDLKGEQVPTVFFQTFIVNRFKQTIGTGLRIIFDESS
jgi:bacterioferritin-associated ferredoxin